MHRGFGTILRTFLWGSNEPRISRIAMINAIQTYFTEAFNSHISIPCFMVKGAITTPAAGATIPTVGPLGTVSTFIPGVINTVTMMKKIKQEPFYVQLVSCIEDFLRTCTVTVDIKSIGAMLPMMVPFSTIINMNPFGQLLESNMKAVKAPNPDVWYAALDIHFEQIWNYIYLSEVFYSSPCAGGIFNGTITFTGLSLAV